MIQLRPYQSDLISRTYQAYHEGNRNVLAVLPTGGGKSVIVSQFTLDGHQQGLTECVIAHRNELVNQMSLHVARRGIPHRIIASKSAVAQITAEHRREFGRSLVNPDARCSVVSVDTLIARQEQLAAWAAQVQRWTIDECFPAGTMIATPDGERPIEAVRVGDVVIAFDEHTGTFHSRKVVRLFRNPAPHTMFDISINGSNVLTTPGHPFWTKRGWVEAKDLNDGDWCLVELHGVRHSVRDEGSPRVSTAQNGQGVLSEVLRDDLQIEAREKATAAPRRANAEAVPCMLHGSSASDTHDMLDRVPVQNRIRNDGAHEPQIRIGTHEAQQPDEKRFRSRQDDRHDSAHRSQAEAARRKRQAANRSGAEVDRHADSVRLHLTTGGSDGLGEEPWSDTLQTRHGSSNAQDSDRSGREIARNNSEAAVGRSQGRIFAWRRVDRVEVQERADFERSDDGHVYNIEVDDLHTYIANGIVVHNCHHVLRANKWGKAVAMFPNAYGLGVTATPRRADGMGLGTHHDGVFDTMILGPSMRDLIDMGALCDYEIAIPESDFSIDDDALAPSGDWSTKRMREASKRSHIVGDVVIEYQRRAIGKRAICFATDVETAGEMAARFNDAGILAAAVSAKTPTEIRNEYIRRFRDGRLTVLVNVDLFGEGFDVPAVEVVIMARPTASLAVYLQQFGRALRPMVGKHYGLVIDHVSNWKRHSFPDKPHIWSLDRREKRAKREPDPDDIPLTACRACSRPYERIHSSCPYCGEQPVPAGGGRTIDQVDGDLMLLDREVLAQMRAAMTLEAPGAVLERVHHATGNAIAAKGAANRMTERHAAQERLTAAIEQWAGVRRAAGEADSVIARRFYHAVGVDVLSAMSGSRAEMESLAQTVESWYA